MLYPKISFFFLSLFSADFVDGEAERSDEKKWRTEEKKLKKKKKKKKEVKKRKVKRWGTLITKIFGKLTLNGNQKRNNKTDKRKR